MTHTLIDRINEAVEAVWENEEWKYEYMKYYVFKHDCIEEGIKKGIKKGIDEGFRRVIISMNHHGTTPEEIAELTGIPKDFVMKTLMEID